MYIAMNHFSVNPDRCEDFERAWRDRDSFLAGTPGFQDFRLLKGSVDENGKQLYASHTIWQDESSFRAWVSSEAFKKAHAQGKLTGIIAGPPRFVGWHAVDI